MGVNSASYLILPKILGLVTNNAVPRYISSAMGIIGAYATAYIGHILSPEDLTLGIRRHAGNDERKEQTLNNAHPHKPRVERVLYSQCQIFRTEDVPDVSRGISTDDSHRRTEYNEERHYCYQSQNLRQYEVRSRVNAHYVECIDLLSYPHCP